MMVPEKKRISDDTKERIIAFTSPIALLLIWQICNWTGVIDDRFIPSPISIALSGYELAVSGELWRHVQASLIRLSAGFVLAAIPAVILGLIMGLSRWVRAAIDPIVAALYPIPKISILPLIMLIFGIGEMSKIVIVALGVFFLVLINTVAGVRTLQPIYFDVAQNYGAPKFKLFTRVVLPGAAPLIFVGFRLGVGVSLIVIVAAEFVAAQSGIGFLIWSSWQVMRVEYMFVGIIVITILGLTANSLLKAIEFRVLPWMNLRT